MLGLLACQMDTTASGFLRELWGRTQVTRSACLIVLSPKPSCWPAAPSLQGRNRRSKRAFVSSWSRLAPTLGLVVGHQSVASDGLLRDLLGCQTDHTQSPWVPLTCWSPRGTLPRCAVASAVDECGGCRMGKGGKGKMEPLWDLTVN